MRGREELFRLNPPRINVCLLLARAQEPPETPEGFRVVSSSSRTANLTWRAPFDGRSQITAFLVQYKRSFGEEATQRILFQDNNYVRMS